VIFGVSPHLNLDGDLVGYISSALGAIIVLVAGSAWRKSKRRRDEQLALTTGAAARPGDQASMR
jgi:hypothetical protein